MKSLKNKLILWCFVLFVLTFVALFFVFDIEYSNRILSWRTFSSEVANVHSDFWERHVRIDGKEFHHLYGDGRAFGYVPTHNVVFFVVRDDSGSFHLHVYDLLKKKEAIFSGDASGFGYNLGAEKCNIDIIDLNSKSKKVVIDNGYERRIFELNYDTLLVFRIQ